MGSVFARARATQLAWISAQRIFEEPAFVIDVTRVRAPLEYSPGTKPR